MLAKFTVACALAVAAVQGRSNGYSEKYSPEPEVKGKNYSRSKQYSPEKSYDFEWNRRSTFRPLDVHGTQIVDKYWETAAEETETIKATCDFEFVNDYQKDYYKYTTGSVKLVQDFDENTSIIGEFTGLTPGLHAFKIMEYGDLTEGCESTGDVYNPFYAKAGFAGDDINDRRVGDIEQIQVNYNGDAKQVKMRDPLVELSGPQSVIGRSMVVFSKAHKYGRTSYGKRIGCCVIGLAKGAQDPRQLLEPFKLRPEEEEAEAPTEEAEADMKADQFRTEGPAWVQLLKPIGQR